MLFNKLVYYGREEFEDLIRRRASLRKDVEDRVRKIILNVEQRGDEAILESLNKFHGFPLDGKLMISEEELEKAYESVPDSFKKALERMRDNVVELAKEMMPRNIELVKPTHSYGVVWRPIRRVGVYVPGGNASYPSTVIMTVAVARVAGVREVYVATPPGERGLPNTYTLATLYYTGVDGVFLAGGAEAAAAFALGTQTIPKVDKIVGPGGIWFTTAKALLSSRVGIDFLAGPTEIAIVADGHADDRLIAADLIAQAEHSPDTFPIIIGVGEEVIWRVGKALEVMLSFTKRVDMVRRAVSLNGLAVVVSDLNEAVEAVNIIAPEHVHLSVKNPRKMLDLIENAGAVSVGSATPASFPDYFAGTNHVLPTNGWARFRGGLSVYDFVKPVYYVEANCKAVREYNEYTQVISSVEGLEAHYESFRARLEYGLCSDNKE